MEDWSFYIFTKKKPVNLHFMKAIYGWVVTLYPTYYDRTHSHIIKVALCFFVWTVDQGTVCNVKAVPLSHTKFCVFVSAHYCSCRTNSFNVLMSNLFLAAAGSCVQLEKQLPITKQSTLILWTDRDTTLNYCKGVRLSVCRISKWEKLSADLQHIRFRLWNYEWKNAITMRLL